MYFSNNQSTNTGFTKKSLKEELREDFDNYDTYTTLAEIPQSEKVKDRLYFITSERKYYIYDTAIKDFEFILDITQTGYNIKDLQERVEALEKETKELELALTKKLEITDIIPIIDGIEIIKENVERMNNYILGLDNTLITVLSRLTNIETIMEETTQRIIKMESTLFDLKIFVNVIDTKVEQLGDRVSQNEVDIETLYNNKADKTALNAIGNSITIINNNLANKQNTLIAGSNLHIINDQINLNNEVNITGNFIGNHLSIESATISGEANIEKVNVYDMVGNNIELTGNKIMFLTNGNSVMEISKTLAVFVSEVKTQTLTTAGSSANTLVTKSYAESLKQQSDARIATVESNKADFSALIATNTRVGASEGKITTLENNYTPLNTRVGKLESTNYTLILPQICLYDPATMKITRRLATKTYYAGNEFCSYYVRLSGNTHLVCLNSLIECLEWTSTGDLVACIGFIDAKINNKNPVGFVVPQIRTNIYRNKLTFSEIYTMYGNFLCLRHDLSANREVKDWTEVNNGGERYKTICGSFVCEFAPY